MTTEALKVSLFNEIRKHHVKSANHSDEQLSQLIFHHNGGLRLTFTGFMILKNIFTVYSFEMDIRLKSRHYIGMSVMSYPYYITSKRLILFSEMDAMVIKLSGSVDNFLNTQYELRRD